MTKTTKFIYTQDCLPGYYGETPGVSAVIAHNQNDCLFQNLTASQKWEFLALLTFWQWCCAEAETTILEAACSFNFELSDEIETLISILAQHNANDRDAYILINALTKQVFLSVCQS